MLVVKDDTEKVRQYAIMRRRATGLLAGFAVLFVIVSVVAHLRPEFAPFWVRLVRATARSAAEALAPLAAYGLRVWAGVRSTGSRCGSLPPASNFKRC